MASEASLWKKVKLWLHLLDPVRIESRLDAGVPDVNCISAWIELKHFDRWDKYDEVNLDEIPFTLEQRIWLRRRWLAGGGAFLLLRIGISIYLFNGLAAFSLPPKLSHIEAANRCVSFWKQSDPFIARELTNCLKYRI